MPVADPLRVRVDRLEEENERLQRECALLRRELADARGPAPLLPAGIIIGPAQRAVFAAIASAGGKAVSLDRLMGVLYSDGGGCEATLRAIIHKMRRRLPPGISVVACYGDGYRLVDERPKQ